MSRGIHVVVSVATLHAFSAAVDPSAQGVKSCDDLLRAIEAVKATDPDAHRSWPGINPLTKALQIQRDRVRWSRSGHVTGQLDLAGCEVEIR